MLHLIHKLSQFIIKTPFKVGMYAEIEKVGGLKNALNIEFNKIGSELKVSTKSHFDKIPVTYARVEKDNKFSQIYIASQSKLYLPDFWRDGVCLAHGKTKNFNELAKVLDTWLNRDITIAELCKEHSFVIASHKSIAFDEGSEVGYTWELIQSDASKGELKEFVELAIKDEVLSKLFPFTSLNVLCFSRCTGYPYTRDTPAVIPVGKNTFQVKLPSNVLVGNGTAAEALRMVKDNLPKGIKPAVKGTSDDLK